MLICVPFFWCLCFLLLLYVVKHVLDRREDTSTREKKEMQWRNHKKNYFLFFCIEERGALSWMSNHWKKIEWSSFPHPFPVDKNNTFPPLDVFFSFSHKQKKIWRHKNKTVLQKHSQLLNSLMRQSCTSTNEYLDLYWLQMSLSNQAKTLVIIPSWKIFIATCFV